MTFIKSFLAGQIVLFFLILSPARLFSQAPKALPQNGTFRLPYIIEGEDTIPVVNLPMVDIIDIANPDYMKD